MSSSTKVIPFRTNAAQALRNATLRGAMRNATDTFTIKRADALSGVPLEEWREEASAMRLHVLDNLSDYVDRFERNATRAGAKVHRAKDSQEARERIGSILKDHGIAKVVKSKSMVSEEIHLNDYLESQGISAVETDLGEIHHTDCGGRAFSHHCPCDSQGPQTSGEAFRREAGRRVHG